MSVEITIGLCQSIIDLSIRVRVRVRVSALSERVRVRVSALSERVREGVYHLAVADDGMISHEVGELSLDGSLCALTRVNVFIIVTDRI